MKKKVKPKRIQKMTPVRHPLSTDMVKLNSRLDEVAKKLGYESRNELLSTYILSL